jgi:hypothetical protein
MIGKMKILVLVFSLVLGGSAATMAMSGGLESDSGCKDAPKTVYKVHLKDVEAIYDHYVFLQISSENGEPVCGTIEIFFPKLQEREYRKERESWEKEEGEEEDPEEEYEEEERGEEERKEEERREGECEDGGCCREEDEDCKERKLDERSRKKEGKRGEGKNAIRFNFKEGRGRFLLFPSSHRALGATAVITIQSYGKVKITPFIYVKNTGVVVYPDSKDEEGQYCKIERTREGVGYYFEDLMDSPELECDWDYDDVVLYMARPQKKEYRDKEDGEREEKEKR